MKRINVLLLLAIFCLSLFSSPLAALAESQDVVARVNGVAITRGEFLSLLEEAYGSYALQELLQKELVRQKAEELQVTVDEAEFEQTYGLILAQLGGPQGLQMFLAQNGITQDQFIEQLRWNMLISTLASTEVEADEETVLQWFEENRAFYDQPELVEVSHILVETQEEAEEILGLLRGGAELAELAQERSLDPGTAPQGGYLGSITKGLTVPEFEELAFSLAVGEFGLTESNFGWHVVTVHSKQEAVPAVYENIADLVERDYRRTKALDAQSYVFKLEKEAELEIFWPAE